jgi:hypothetical protein
VNTGWQNVLQKTPDELLGADGHGLLLRSAGTLISEGDLAVFGRDYSAIGNGYTVNVAGEIIEDCTGTLNSRFTVNDPVLLPYVSRQANILKSPFDTLTKALAKQS